MKKILFLTSISAVALVAAPAAAIPFSGMTVFGDSLSDTGNTKASLGFLGELWFVEAELAGYGNNGRFTNGPVWHEYLADQLGISRASASLNGGTNYAYGGAEVDYEPGPTQGLLLQEVEYALDTGYVSDPDQLYVSWIGGNDVRAAIGDADGAQQIDFALADYEDMLERLVASGASTLLLPNLPDIGRIPENRGTADSAEATALTVRWNEGLSDIVTNLTLSTSAEVYQLDVFGLFNDILASPGDYGFSNTTGTCRRVFLGLFEYSCRRADRYVFWDDVHPTTAAHRLLGDAAYDLLTMSPLMAVSSARTSLLAEISIVPQQQIPGPGALGLMGLGLLLMAHRRGLQSKTNPPASTRR